MLAPRRVPPCLTTSVDASNSDMKETGPGGHAHGGAYDVVLGTKAGEAEPGAAPRLMDQRHGSQGVIDAALAIGERIVHRKHEAG